MKFRSAPKGKLVSIKLQRHWLFVNTTFVKLFMFMGDVRTSARMGA
jgi:hypothetical protein